MPSNDDRVAQIKQRLQQNAAAQEAASKNAAEAQRAKQEAVKELHQKWLKDLYAMNQKVNSLNNSFAQNGVQLTLEAGEGNPGTSVGQVKVRAFLGNAGRTLDINAFENGKASVYLDSGHSTREFDFAKVDVEFYEALILDLVDRLVG
jgi:hypothetical protein